MNTEQPAAPGTGPPFPFVSQEMSYAELLDVREIFDHAHAVLGPITLIQVVQPVAREPVAAEAVPGLTAPYVLTGLDPAGGAGLWFDAVVAPATGARILISCIRDTEAAVHSTGSNQRRSDRICLCWSYWGHRDPVLGPNIGVKRPVH
jgi:hypothetical protein